MDLCNIDGIIHLSPHYDKRVFLQNKSKFELKILRHLFSVTISVVSRISKYTESSNCTDTNMASMFETAVLLCKDIKIDTDNHTLTDTQMDTRAHTHYTEIKCVKCAI